MSERLQRLKDTLQLYVDCEIAILTGAQEYSIGTRRLRRADLAEIRKTIRDLEREIELMVKGTKRIRTVGIVPRDL